MLRAEEPFRTIFFQQNTLSIDKKVVKNKLQTDQAAQAFSNSKTSVGKERYEIRGSWALVYISSSVWGRNHREQVL